MKPTEAEVKKAIQVILADRKCYRTSLNYAVGYCNYAMSMSGHELEVQCLYILNNITGWRNPEAKAVRDTLKSFSKRS